MNMMVQSGRFGGGGGGGGASSTKWRVRCPHTWLNDPDSLGFSNIAMYETVGGADCTASGCTMTADTQFSGFNPSNTTDSNIDTIWTTGVNAAPGGGHWIQAEFTTAKAITIVNLTPRRDGYREDPKEMYIEYWDGAAWQIAISAAVVPAWLNGEPRTFFSGTPFTAAPFGAHRYWRLSSIVANADGLVIIPEIQLREDVSGPDATGAGTATGTVGNFAEPGEGAAKAFDDNEGTQWQPATPAYVTYDFGAGVTKGISEVLIRQNDGWSGRTPASFDVDYSDNGSSWTTATSFAPGNTWAGGTRAFRLVASPTDTNLIVSI